MSLFGTGAGESRVQSAEKGTPQRVRNPWPRRAGPRQPGPRSHQVPLPANPLASFARSQHTHVPARSLILVKVVQPGGQCPERELAGRQARQLAARLAGLHVCWRGLDRTRRLSIGPDNLLQLCLDLPRRQGPCLAKRRAQACLHFLHVRGQRGEVVCMENPCHQPDPAAAPHRNNPVGPQSSQQIPPPIILPTNFPQNFPSKTTPRTSSEHPQPAPAVGPACRAALSSCAPLGAWTPARCPPGFRPPARRGGS